MARHDGNGWVQCRCGSRHWGRFGAAGLLVHRGPPQHRTVLLQLRADWVHQGGTWAAPGGAADSHETMRAAALREAAEEAGVRESDVRVRSSVICTDHGDWTYTMVLGELDPAGVAPHPSSSESVALRWFHVRDVPSLALHPGLSASWPDLAHALALIVETPWPRR